MNDHIHRERNRCACPDITLVPLGQALPGIPQIALASAEIWETSTWSKLLIPQALHLLL